MRFTRRAATLLAALLTAVGLTAATVAPAQAATTTKATVYRNHTTVYAGHSITVSGSVTPSKYSRTVYLQRYYSGAWHSEWRTSTVSGKYKMVIPVSRVGTRTYRVYIPAGSGGTSFKSASFVMKGVSHKVASVTNKSCKYNAAKRTIAYSFKLTFTDGHYKTFPTTYPITMHYDGPVGNSGWLGYITASNGEVWIVDKVFYNCVKVG